MTQARIHSFETFGSVDGPGVRFVVFLQGCRMRCRYCHNPDSWTIDAGEIWSAQDILEKALRYRSYWGDEGGVTVSGGEPLLQIDFLLEFFELLKSEGIHTVIDTCGEPFTREAPFYGKFRRLMAFTDLVMLDLKHIRTAEHKKLTGRDPRPIFACARELSDIGKPLWIRHVLVPGWTDEDGALKELRAFIDTLRTVERVEVLPFHNYAEFKWEKLGIKYSLKGAAGPTKERVANAERILGARSR